MNWVTLALVTELLSAASLGLVIRRPSLLFRQASQSLLTLPSPFPVDRAVIGSVDGAGEGGGNSSLREKDSTRPQLTQFALERVVLQENGRGVPKASSADKPVHVGVPAVHKATEMIFFKVTFWQRRNEDALCGDTVTPRNIPPLTAQFASVFRYVSHSL